MVAAGYGALGRACNRAICAGAALLVGLAAWAGPASAEPGPRAPVTVAAMGDSLTQGYGLPMEDGFVPVLEGWLQARGHDVRITNAGVSGDTTAGGLARMDWTLADDPDAMIVALGGNDLLRGLDPAESRANLDAILSRASEAGVPVLLAAMPAPGNYGPDFERDFAAMYPELAEKHDVLLHENFLQPMMDRIETGDSIADLMQDDNIHPNADGVQRIVDAIGPKVEELILRAYKG